VSGVRIGIDFDNTIICYDQVFAAAARQRGLVSGEWTGSKTDVREYLRSKPGGELAWQGLQGWVYGKGIDGAEIFPGVMEFLGACRQNSAGVCIVSHKTQFGHQDPDRTDLRVAARDWLRATGLIGAENSALASLDLDVFIDDLADVFEQPHFPRGIKSILFASNALPGPYKSIASWAEIQREVFAA
jgi:hypothetical protein